MQASVRGSLGAVWNRKPAMTRPQISAPARPAMRQRLVIQHIQAHRRDAFPGTVRLDDIGILVRVLAVDGQLARAKHLAHAPFADRRDDFVNAESNAWSQGQVAGSIAVRPVGARLLLQHGDLFTDAGSGALRCSPDAVGKPYATSRESPRLPLRDRTPIS